MFVIGQRPEAGGVRKPEFGIEERCKIFALEVIKLVKNFPKTTEGFVIGKQLIRSATSIGANLAEGIGAASKKDFINYRHISRKSAFETKYWLELALAANLATKERIDPLLQENEIIIKILSRIITNSQSK